MTDNQFPSSVASAGVAGAASGIASAGVNYFLNSRMMEKEQKYYRENASMQYHYGQQAQRNSVGNLVNSARAAGINPVAVVGENAPASVGSSAPMPNKALDGVRFPVGEMSGAIKEMSLLDSQKRNVDANTNKTEAEAHNLGIEGEKSALELQFTKDYNQNFALELESQDKELWNSYVNAVRKDNPEATDEDIRQGFTPGVLIGHIGYNEQALNLMKNFNAKQLEKAISLNPRYAKSLAAMPSAEIDKLREDVAYVKALEDTQAYLQEKLVADTTLSKAEVSKIEADIIKIGQDIKESDARIDRMTSEKVRNYGVAVSSGLGALTDLIELGATGGALTAAKGATKAAKGAYKNKEVYRKTKNGYTKEFSHFPAGD